MKNVKLSNSSDAVVNNDSDYLVRELVSALRQLEDPFKRVVLTRIAESLSRTDRRSAELALQLFEEVSAVSDKNWVKSVN